MMPYMVRPNAQIILVVIVAITSIILVVDQRLDALHEGGAINPALTMRVIESVDANSAVDVAKAGLLTPPLATPPFTTANARVGDIIRTDATTWTKYALESLSATTYITLAENTQLKIVSSNTGTPVLQIIEGRLIINGPAVMTVRETKVTTADQTAFTFYSWLDQLEVAPLEGNVEIMQGGTPLPLPYPPSLGGAELRGTGRSLAKAGLLLGKEEGKRILLLDTLPPYAEPQVSTFSPENSSAHAFYEWAF